VKRLLLVVALAWVPIAGLSGSPEGQRVWFKFNKAFINAHYADGEAFGTIKAQTWGAPKNVHSTKCGGIDGELHVGALEGGVTVPASQSPISGKASSDDADWGLVFELPDAKAGKGPVTLTKHAGTTVTFTGYFRVWNEGHWKGQVRRATPITCSTCIRRGDYDRNVSLLDLPCSKDLRNHLTTRLIRVDLALL
jgi:hypothetical protein